MKQLFISPSDSPNKTKDMWNKEFASQKKSYGQKMVADTNLTVTRFQDSEGNNAQKARVSCY